MTDAYAFGKRWKDRIIDAVEAVEGDTRQDNRMPRGVRAFPGTGQVMIVKTKAGALADGMYPCDWQTSDVAGAPSMSAGGEAGWVYNVNGGALARLKYYVAILRGIRTSDSKCVYFTNGDPFLASVVTAGSDQSVSGGTPLRVSWGGSNSTFWSSGTPTKFTIPTGFPSSLVKLSGTGHFLSPTDIQKNYGCRWLINQVGTPAMPLTDMDGGCMGGPLKQHEDSHKTMGAGDFAELFVFHTNTSTQTFRGLDACCEIVGFP